MVMNSKEKKWMMDIQHQAIKEYRDFMDWDTIVLAGYCILNEASKAFMKTNCRLPDEEDVMAYAYMVEHIFLLPVFYVEYRVSYGDLDLVRHTSVKSNHALLFYGG